MAFSFSDALADLRTKTEWTTYLSDTTTYQGTQAYTDYLSGIPTATAIFTCKTIVIRIFSSLNKNNMNTTDTSIDTYTMNICTMTAEEQTDLDSVIVAKGYTITKNGDLWTFS